MSRPVRVVLLGGGYVTLHAYRVLARRLRPELRRGTVELVVVSADDAHSFHGFTPEVVAGHLPCDVTRTALAAAMPMARVLHARVVHVDPAWKRMALLPADPDDPSAEVPDRLGYDELVVGVGSREPVHAVPGMLEHGYTLRGPGDIERLAARCAQLGTRVSTGDLDEAGRTVVVAGGGLCGVELAAAVASRGAGQLRVLLVHSGEALVPQLAGRFPGLAHRVERELCRAGVELVLGERLLSCGADRVTLAGGRVVPTRTVVATVGQTPVTLPGLERLPVDTGGRLVTRSDLSVADGIWAAGDVARVVHPGTGEPVPANALWAIKGGARIGANVARVVRGRVSHRFRYRGLGQAATFGRGRAVAELYGVPLTGRTAWVLRLVFFLRFVPAPANARRVLRHTVRPGGVPPPPLRAAAEPDLTRAA